jgi:DNA repair protein RadA/Sms
MAKQSSKTKFECNGCGRSTPKWVGKCSECGEWNTVVEKVVRTESARQAPGIIDRVSRAAEGFGSERADEAARVTVGVISASDSSLSSALQPPSLSFTQSGSKDRLATVELSRISADGVARMPTGIDELDRVLGGGFVGGSSVLLGGDGGIGKSTLLLQAADAIASKTDEPPTNPPPKTRSNSSIPVGIRATPSAEIRLNSTVANLSLLPD